MIRRPPRSTLDRSSAASDVYKRQVKFILDENFVPTGLYVKERKEAHMLIEDLMLLANKRVAFHLAKNFTKVPFVYRVHDTPDMKKLEEFSLNARRFGYKLKLDSPKNVSAELNSCLLYTSDAADERSSVDLGGRRIIKKKTKVRNDS